MKIVRFHEKGVPEVLKVEDAPVPEPREGEVLIRVEAAGINYGDTLRRGGRHYPLPTPLPYAPGNEVVGVIEKVGAGGDSSQIGQRVFASPPSGGYAEYTVASASTVYPTPNGLDPVNAVAIMDQGISAALILKRAGRIKVGDTVLIPAAAGGVGALAVQLARIYGASKVIGLASTVEKRALVCSIGADTAIDYTQENWSKQVIDATDGVGVDLALEMSGGAVFQETLLAVRQQHGRVAIYGNASDEAVAFNPRLLVGRNMSITGFLLPGNADARGETLAELSQFVLDGRLKPQIGGTFSLEEAPEAHRAMETRNSTGKLILVPQNK